MSGYEDTQDALQELRKSREDQALDASRQWQAEVDFWVRRIQTLDYDYATQRAELVGKYNRAKQQAAFANFKLALASPTPAMYQ
jgi:hypothetical protein